MSRVHWSCQEGNPPLSRGSQAGRGPVASAARDSEMGMAGPTHKPQESGSAPVAADRRGVRPSSCPPLCSPRTSGQCGQGQEGETGAGDGQGSTTLPRAWTWKHAPHSTRPLFLVLTAESSRRPSDAGPVAGEAATWSALGEACSHLHWQACLWCCEVLHSPSTASAEAKGRALSTLRPPSLPLCIPPSSRGARQEGWQCPRGLSPGRGGSGPAGTFSRTSDRENIQKETSS